MQKVTNLLHKTKKIFNKQTQYLLLIEISLIIFVVTVALNYIFDYVYTVSVEKSSVSTWEYVYTDGSSNDYYGEWNVANSLEPLSTEKTADYLHMRNVFEPSDEDRALIIYTDYSPVKISVNGKTVYNNHYGESSFVGNIYNSVTLPASGGETLVEVSVALPFSANIKTEMSTGAPSRRVQHSFWLIGSGVIILLGVLLLLASVICLFAKRRTAVYFIVSASVIAYGAFSVMFAMSENSYYLNFPRAYNITVLLVNLFVFIFLAVLKSLFKIKDKKFSVLLGVYALVTLLVLIPQNPTVLKVLISVAGAAGTAATVTLAYACGKLLSKRIQYSKTAFIILCYLALLTASCTAMHLTGFISIWISCERLGGLLLICFIMIMSVASANIFSARKNEAEETEIKNHSECVEKLAGLIKNVLSGRSENEICRMAAGDICDLAQCCSTPSDASDIAYSMAVKSDDGYKVIESKGFDEAVRFDVIENRYYTDEVCYNFAQTYFDFVFLKDNEPHIIFYFQNISNGLSLFFVQMMETAFNCIQVAFEELPENKGGERKTENGFINLAKNAEFNDGGKTDHLQCVADYTEIIMKSMGYPEHVCEVVSGAAMLHDIGKIAIPQGITNKSSLLTESERSIMKSHTDFGYIILSAFEGEFMQAAAVIAKDHHEQYDGRGYGGLKGEDIHEYARVVTVADVFDALTTQRSYKEAWSLDAAVEYINANSGKIFDPAVVSALNGCLDEITERYREKNQ